ncbi:MAG: hypothetical protein RLZZ383_35 [Pseudomonadota bacterium]|jgi:hypothetical protein
MHRATPFLLPLLAACADAPSGDAPRGNGASLACLDEGRTCLETGVKFGILTEEECLAEGFEVVDACPLEGAIGTCFGGDPNGLWTSTTYYTDDTDNAADASLACTTIGGTWTAY